MCVHCGVSTLNNQNESIRCLERFRVHICVCFHSIWSSPFTINSIDLYTLSLSLCLIIVQLLQFCRFFFFQGNKQFATNSKFSLVFYRADSLVCIIFGKTFHVNDFLFSILKDLNYIQDEWFQVTKPLRNKKETKIKKKIFHSILFPSSCNITFASIQLTPYSYMAPGKPVAISFRRFICPMYVIFCIH